MRTMVLAMESPSPVPPVARLIHAVEALEDVFQLVGRNAAALVAHGQARAVLVGRDGNANGSAGGRVAGGVVEKDEEQLAQQGFIRVYAQTGLRLRLIWMRGVDFTPLREQVVQKARNVDGFLFQRLRAVVAARQEQQVLRQVGHVFRLAPDGRHAFIQHGGIVPSPAAEQLGIALQRGQRRAQLVRSVLRELPLPGERVLDAVEHVVQRLRQQPQLVVLARKLHARVQRAAVDRARLADDGGKRREHLLRGELSNAQRDERAADVQRQKEPRQHLEEFIFAVDAFHDHEIAREFAVDQHGHALRQQRETVFLLVHHDFPNAVGNGGRVYFKIARPARDRAVGGEKQQHDVVVRAQLPQHVRVGGVVPVGDLFQKDFRDVAQVARQLRAAAVEQKVQGRDEHAQGQHERRRREQQRMW